MAFLLLKIKTKLCQIISKKLAVTHSRLLLKAFADVFTILSNKSIRSLSERVLSWTIHQ